MSWVAVAVGGASLVGGYMSSKGAKDAAKASAQGSDRAAQVQWDMFNRATQLNEPFRQGGLAGLQEYMAFLGMPTGAVSSASSASNTPMPTEWLGAGNIPSVNSSLYASDPRYRAAWDQATREHQQQFGKGYNQYSDANVITQRLQQLYAQQAAPSGAVAASPGAALTSQQITEKLRATPNYQFSFDEGQRALESSAAARGGLFSGAAGKALTKYGQGVADQQYGTHLNRLASLAGIGQTATAQNNQMGMQTAGNVGNALQNAGNARASGIAGSANAWGSTLGQLAGIGGYMYGNRNGSGGGWGWGGV